MKFMLSISASKAISKAIGAVHTETLRQAFKRSLEPNKLAASKPLNFISFQQISTNVDELTSFQLFYEFIMRFWAMIG